MINIFEDVDTNMKINIVENGDVYTNESSIITDHIGKILMVIEVRGQEGTIPHFHLINKAKKFECCICINEAKYFNHKGNEQTLNSSEKKDLNMIMHKKYNGRKYSDFNGKYIWELVQSLWNVYNKENISYTSEIPDYSIMEENIHK